MNITETATTHESNLPVHKRPTPNLHRSRTWNAGTPYDRGDKEIGVEDNTVLEVGDVQFDDLNSSQEFRHNGQRQLPPPAHSVELMSLAHGMNLKGADRSRFLSLHARSGLRSSSHNVLLSAANPSYKMKSRKASRCTDSSDFFGTACPPTGVLLGNSGGNPILSPHTALLPLVPRMLSNEVLSHIARYQQFDTAKTPAAVARSAQLVGSSMRRMPGALMLADVKGFTKLTELLSRKGTSGVELLTACMNNYFSLVISTIHAHDGDVVSFAGDAMIVAFLANESQNLPTDGIESATLRAVKCAHELCERYGNMAMRHDGMVEPVPTRTSVEVSSHNEHVEGRLSSLQHSFFRSNPSVSGNSQVRSRSINPSHQALAETSMWQEIGATNLSLKICVGCGQLGVFHITGCDIDDESEGAEGRERRMSGVHASGASRQSSTMGWMQAGDERQEPRWFFFIGDRLGPDSQLNPHARPPMAQVTAIEPLASAGSVVLSTEAADIVKMQWTLEQVTGGGSSAVAYKLVSSKLYQPSPRMLTQSGSFTSHYPPWLRNTSTTPSSSTTNAFHRPSLSYNSHASPSPDSWSNQQLDVPKHPRRTQTRMSNVFSLHVPHGVRSKIRSQQLDFVNEVRPLTVLFIGFPSLSDRAYPTSVAQLAAVRATVSATQKVMLRQEGTMLQYRADEKGFLAICAFGLPGSMHSDNPARGIAAACEIVRLVHESDHTACIGVATGNLLVTFVGAMDTRCELTVFGDAINLSARLMCKAKAGLGMVLCDEATFNSHDHSLLCEQLPSIDVKGKAEPVRVFRITPPHLASILSTSGLRTTTGPSTTLTSAFQQSRLSFKGRFTSFKGSHMSSVRDGCIPEVMETAQDSHQFSLSDFLTSPSRAGLNSTSSAEGNTVKSLGEQSKAVLRRMDALPDGMQLTLKVASVMGATVDVDLLHIIHPETMSMYNLRSHMDALERALFLKPFSAQLWEFSMPDREVVYQVLPAFQRRKLHASLAQELECAVQDSPCTVESLSIIARHWEQACAEHYASEPGCTLKAIEFWQKAATVAEEGRRWSDMLLVLQHASELAELLVFSTFLSTNRQEPSMPQHEASFAAGAIGRSGHDMLTSHYSDAAAIAVAAAGAGTHSGHGMFSLGQYTTSRRDLMVDNMQWDLVNDLSRAKWASGMARGYVELLAEGRRSSSPEQPEDPHTRLRGALQHCIQGLHLLGVPPLEQLTHIQAAPMRLQRVLSCLCQDLSVHQEPFSQQEVMVARDILAVLVDIADQCMCIGAYEDAAEALNLCERTAAFFMASCGPAGKSCMKAFSSTCRKRSSTLQKACSKGHKTHLIDPDSNRQA